jgi:mRNA interferase HigB
MSNKMLVQFSLRQAEADAPLQAWRKIVEESSFSGFAHLKSAFGSLDKVGDWYVFNIGGNKYRLVATIHFNRQMLFIRHVLTHKEYDKWKP